MKLGLLLLCLALLVQLLELLMQAALFQLLLLVGCYPF
jgi:hypothetical protein